MARAAVRIAEGPWNYDEYALLPDDGKRYEILDGELAVSPAPRPRHQGICRNLARILDSHIVKLSLGQIYFAPIDVILDPHTIAQPDILFIPSGRNAIITDRAVEGPPELVVEILSPGTVRRDRVTKAKLYARFGVPHYWIVDPDKRIFETYEIDNTAYRLAQGFRGSQVVTSSLFPGLSIRLTAVWV